MNYLLFFLLVTVTICQDEYGCEDCECPDLFDKYDSLVGDKSSVLYTKEAGCVYNITCMTSIPYHWTLVMFHFNDSEIPLPDNAFDYALARASNIEAPIDLIVNIFEFFGMVCENSEWYFTKYPHGISYRNSTGEYIIGADGELDGKKSKIDEFYCTPLSK
ncbi:hypothetical protein GCK72_015766 [Caenorhabditis remanei]|uniref:Uncharacterized protein n=1 Tax=Caenorhabditis remanei TaxID=31234 RepID=A0A6A5GXD2_CAERE|nr:hypothetical protein GCK72_015766 [Caenorhabditis remanei]KAF1759301.1 hypothetical protein GCK72_015766 [Caenorhabditis remanei]